MGQTFFTTRIDIHLRPQHEVHHSRHDGARQEVRHHHREDDRERQWRKQKLRGTGEQQHGDENNANRERGNKRGYGDLLRPVEDRARQRLRHAHIAVNIFDFDGRIVDQNADGQSHTAQRHPVDRVSHRPEHNAGSENRQRNGGADDQRTAPASQKQENHQRRQAGRDQGFARHALDCRPDKETLVEHRLDVEPGRKARQNRRQQLLHRLDNVQGRRLPVFQNGDQGGPSSVLADDVGLYRISVAHLRHVANVLNGTVYNLQRQIVQPFNCGGAAVEANKIIPVPHFGVARRKNQALGVDRIGEHRLRIQIDHHLGALAAVRRWHRRTLNTGELGAYEILPVIEKLLLAHRLAGEAELQDGHARGVVFQDARRENARRHDAQNRLAQCRDLCYGQIDLYVRLEVNAN